MIDFPWGYGPLCDWCDEYWTDFVGQPMDANHWWCDLPNARSRARDALRLFILPHQLRGKDRVVDCIANYLAPRLSDMTLCDTCDCNSV